ncbi:TspO/MBR family protein [Marinimicrococcus flavescens]|uniref:Tryptophan-rich sensory protein n=1 Tax=Marinimicrococcus flavescens TaxID=3031815 RepID=A0AAP3XSP8_9PROT|nr:tryptophan-rich sensory protein [Marinimicrococcus flavescens]
MSAAALSWRSGRGLAGLALFLALSLLVSGLGGLITSTTVDGWYQTLAKPPFNPPDWLFAPVWTTLFVLMAVAAWRVWLQPPSPDRQWGLRLYGLQLAFNLGWSFLFFGLMAPAAALIEIVWLLALIAATGWLFTRADRVAGLLFVPYLAWVAFAALLNGWIVWLN